MSWKVITPYLWMNSSWLANASFWGGQKQNILNPTSKLKNVKAENTFIMTIL